MRYNGHWRFRLGCDSRCLELCLDEVFEDENCAANHDIYRDVSSENAKKRTNSEPWLLLIMAISAVRHC